MNSNIADRKSNRERFTVLVVDDEEYIVEFFCAALKTWGYNVLAAQNSQEALAVLANYRVDILIVDNWLEEKDYGKMVIEEAQKLYAEAICVLITGLDFGDELLEYCEKNSVIFLQKPIRSNELKILINNVVEKSRKEKEFRQDIGVARSVIENNFPDRLPAYEKTDFFAIYKPVYDVGGDFYDFIELGPENCAFCICDVQGHGLHSALFANSLRIYFRAFVEMIGNDLGVLTAKLNRAMCRQTRSNLMATGFFATFDSSNGEMAYVNSGHEYPIIYRSGESRCELVTSNDMILAIFEEAQYNCRKLTLEKGDIFFAYTDGVCDNHNINNQKFSLDSIKSIIESNSYESAEFIGNKIFSEIKKHIGANLQEDDLAFIILKMK